MSSSRKQEERNEKVIRGLLKLPPNRKCINCNSLGPQYVCTNFWTFVCMTCSGIHREFTHRVKSVSMSKFTSQEVEALQNGGNQRAREMFLKDWDPQRERHPNNSNIEKVRQFIKEVYVDRKYAGGNHSDKHPKDMQNLMNHEDETRRASSYHSFSQSPPYDYQYEERRYGKHAPALTRKPGSDRGIYERKAFSFVSPTRLSEHVYEDGFTNEGFKSRALDYSVSSGGDPFRSGAQSPTFQRDIGFSSPSSETSRDISSIDVQHQKVNTFADPNAKRDEEQVQHLQRTASVGSNSISFKSVNSASNVNVASSVSESFNGLELFNAPYVPQTANSTPAAIDLFESPQALSTSSTDFFQPPPISNVPTLNSHIPSQNSPASSSLSLFSDVVSQQNEGWATFDRPQSSEPNQAFDNSTAATLPSTDGVSRGKIDQFISPNASLQQSSFPDFNGSSSSMPNQWHESVHNVDVPLNATSTEQSWNAFEDSSSGQHHLQSIQQQSNVHIAVQNPSSIADQYHDFGVLEDLNKDGTGRATLSNGPIFGMPSYAGVHSHAADRKSTNPFDLPYDSDMESGNMFLELSSLQAALPNGEMPASFIGGVTQPWFSEDPVASFVAGGPQGALGFMGPQAPSAQIQNVPTQAPVVSSIGGNPFD